MPDLAWIDGDWQPLEDATISVLDRGCFFGDGVYEVIRSYDGRPWTVGLHLARLERSLRELQIDGIDIAHVRELVLEGNRRGGFDAARIYLHVTRGIGRREHVYPESMTPSLLLTVEEQQSFTPDDYARGVTAITAPDLRWKRRDIKSLNLLPNIMAKQRAHEQGAYEAILIEDGLVTEGSSQNVFMVKNGTVVTRENGPHILPGITRNLLVESLAGVGIPVWEGPFTPDHLRSADEVFITGTAPGLLGVTHIDGEPVGSGEVGPITQRITQIYLDRVAKQDDGD